MYGVDVEVVEVEAISPHVHLQDAVQLLQCYGFRYQHPAPNYGAEAQKASLKAERWAWILAGRP